MIHRSLPISDFRMSLIVSLDNLQSLLEKKRGLYDESGNF